MKICFFAETYKPVISGTSISLQRVVKSLEKLGHEVWVITTQYPERPGGRIVYYKSVSLPSRYNIRLGFPTVWSLLPVVRRINPDVIHAQQPFLGGRVAQKIAKILDIPVVGTIHTQYDHEQYLHYAYPIPLKWARYSLQATMRRFCNSCDVVTTPSSGMSKHLIQQIGVHTPLIVVPNGIDLSVFQEANAQLIREKFGWGEERLLLFVGRLTIEKNLQFLLESFALVSKTLPDVRLVLVGDGPERRPLMERARELGLEKSVHFAGWVAHDQVPGFYRAADLFVMPSITEANPLCLGEALAAATPVVAVNSFSAQECLTHGQDAILTPYSREAFSAAVVRILSEPERYGRMREYALRNANRTYTTMRQANDLLNVYQGLVG
jgi:glycosyltransferase involved in cell wall biosynthesis